MEKIAILNIQKAFDPLILTSTEGQEAPLLAVCVADRVEQHGVVVALDRVEGGDGGAEAGPLLVLPHHQVQRAHEEGVLRTVR